MLIALVAGQHWHTQMYLDAFQAAGQGIDLVYVASPGHWPAVTGVRQVDSLAELSAQRPDLVIVLDTPAQMLHITRYFVEQGIPVAVEKPVGNHAVGNRAELLELASLAREQGVLVSVAQPHLLNDFWAHITADTGPLSHFRFRLINGSPQRYQNWGVPWVLDPQVAGGGVLRNLGVHGVSAFQQLVSRQLIGEPVQVASAYLSNALYGLEAEEYASLTLRTRSALGQIEVGYTLGSDQDSEFEMTAHWKNFSLRDDGQNLRLLNRLTGERSMTPCLPLPRRYEQFARATLATLRGQHVQQHDLNAHAQAMLLMDEAYARAEWIRP